MTGLAKAPEHNGKEGRVSACPAAIGRVSVELQDMQKPLAVRLENLELCRQEGAPLQDSDGSVRIIGACAAHLAGSDDANRLWRCLWSALASVSHVQQTMGAKAVPIYLSVSADGDLDVIVGLDGAWGICLRIGVGEQPGSGRSLVHNRR